MLSKKKKERERKTLKLLSVKSNLWEAAPPSNFALCSPEYPFQHRDSDTKQNSGT